jgi:hypothetical protein
MGNALRRFNVAFRQHADIFRPAPPNPSFLDCFFPLTQRLLEARDSQPQGVIIGFTSVARGEGVTHVVTSLARKLAEHSFEQILLTTSADLATAASARFDDSAHVQQLTKPGSVTLSPRAMRWEDLHALRQRFGFVLVDCPAMRVAPSMFTLANLCDAAVLVVAAGEASRSDIENAQKLLKASSVKLMGTVLNKQTDPIPEFISKVL